MLHVRCRLVRIASFVPLRGAVASFLLLPLSISACKNCVLCSTSRRSRFLPLASSFHLCYVDVGRLCHDPRHVYQHQFCICGRRRGYASRPCRGTLCCSSYSAHRCAITCGCAYRRLQSRFLQLSTSPSQ
ncbi:hypothetical protein MPTK1_5g17830 [Marchantia polymorpha subsp. ruderalis]|uniref:Uncharacterized protein n=1 Tax=Marchantia polymorpha subsp. ruderalis TaxID=1480154 RepID=A0AAF6BJH1_MARPO|nr:hypothetical protein Mp_5g17830 [Marchantia polymorpha subsp. ruderalis]